MSIQVIAGSKLFIGSRVSYKSTVTAADFSGQVWQEVGPLTSLGDLVTEYGMASQEVINQGVTQYRKTVKSFPIMENTVLPDRSDVGQIAFQSAVDSCDPFAFMVQRSSDCERASVVTISNGADASVTWANHGLAVGTPVIFSTTGALPTGLVAGTTYYVAATPAPDANTFSVSATVGGPAITTSSAGTGVQTATAQPIGETDMFFGLPTGGGKTGGGASDVQTKNISIQPISNTVTV